MIPPITTVASGRWTSAPAPVAIAIGTNPIDAQNAVASTGRRRSCAPRRTAASRSQASSPSRSEPIWSIITSPLSIAMPDNAMNPIAAVMENGIPRSHRASTPPVTANGIPV